MDEEDDYTTFSKKDLLDLKELNRKAVEHYDKILRNPEMEKDEHKAYKMEIELCKKYTLEDLEKVDKEIQSREDTKK